jgi:hypothetical protein
MHQKLNETSIRLIDLIVSVGCARRNFDLSHGCDSYRGKSFSFQTSSCFMSQHGKSQINHWSTSSPKSLAPLSTSIAAFRNRAYIDAALEQNVIVGGFFFLGYLVFFLADTTRKLASSERRSF